MVISLDRFGFNSEVEHFSGVTLLQQELLARGQRGDAVDFGFVQAEDVAIDACVGAWIREEAARRAAFDYDPQDLGLFEVVG